MDSDQESSECPLCLEVLEADDLSFFPCTCCYQICRFCWHRIRTDENGLCPACRKPYSENPAQFKPLSEEEIQQVKRDRKMKDSHKKPKVTESRKHLANLRVVQRNLVFVNGLPSRLADTELLRRNDHFGKYGKIVKLVTSPAHNGQQNSICVYITYSRSEEALRAIQALCNYHVDGRTLKATLGTTKYCSRYLKGASCQKTDCLYLHEPGDPLASFTKEQMQQGLHLEYERKLMEQYANKTSTTTAAAAAASGQSTTPKSGRTTVNGNKNDSPHRRKAPQPLLNSTVPTPLLSTTINPTTTTTSASSSNSTTNGLLSHSDFEHPESGDETNGASALLHHHHHHHQLNGYNNESFTSTTAINGDTLHIDSDSSSASSSSSQSSEHDPSSTTTSSYPTHLQSFTISPSSGGTSTTTKTNWPEETTSFFTSNNLASPSQQQTQAANKSTPPTPLNVPVTAILCSPKGRPTSLLMHAPSTTITESSSSTTSNNLVKNFDQVPEYKLFSSNGPSLHTLLFGGNENSENNNHSMQQYQQHHRTTTLLNGTEHDLREIEKRLMENGLDNGDAFSTTSYPPPQENDELGFDPCSLFMTALASDIEDERRPSSSTMMNTMPNGISSYRTTTTPSNNHPYGLSSPSSQFAPTSQPMGSINHAWMMQQMQQQQQQQQYHHYHQQQHPEQQTMHSNGTTPQKQQQQQRYPPVYNGSSPRQMWNGPQQPQQFVPQVSTRLDFTNQMQQQQQQQQRLPPRQSSPSPQYSQQPQQLPLNPNNSTMAYTSNNSTVTQNNLPNDRWMNVPWTDPAIISLGNKLENPLSQWSTSSQSIHGSSTLSSGNNLIPSSSASRWPQQQQQQQTHLLTNGVYSPYSTTTNGGDDGNRS